VSTIAATEFPGGAFQHCDSSAALRSRDGSTQSSIAAANDNNILERKCTFAAENGLSFPRSAH
jgi:hypothetical protein